MPRFLISSGRYNRAAIMRAAWLAARAAVAAAASAPAPFRRITTARAEFAQCLVRTWQAAKSERDFALWSAQQIAAAPAEQVRRAALPAAARSVEDARAALALAELLSLIHI